MRSKKPIEEDEVFKFFAKRIEPHWTAHLKSTLYSNFNLKSQGIPLSLLLVAPVSLLIFAIRSYAPFGFGIWIEQSGGISDGEDAATKTIDITSSLISIEALLLTIAVIALAAINKAWHLFSDRLKRPNELVNGWSASAEQMNLLNLIFDQSKSKFIQNRRRITLIKSILCCIKEEIEGLHPIQDGDVSNASLFLYRDLDKIELVARTDGNQVIGNKIPRKNVMAHYAALCGQNLNIYNTKGLPFKFESLSNGPTHYNSILAIPITKKGKATKAVGVITIDSQEPYRFVGMRKDIFNRIRPQIGILVELYAKHRYVVERRAG